MAYSLKDDLGIFRPVHADYFAEHPDHRWEAGKFNLDLNDVFTTLPKQFNLMAIPILDRDSFRLETQYVSRLANNRTEFYHLLQTRLEARRTEQIKMIMQVFVRLAGDPDQMDLPDRLDRHWCHAMHFSRFKSFDTIVRFFAGFLRDEEPANAIAPLPATQNDHTTRQPSATSSTQNTKNAPNSPPPDIFAQPSSNSSITDKSHKSSPPNSPRTRKRSLTPTKADDDQNQGEARPTKKTRFADDMIEPSAARSSFRRPISPRATRLRKGQPLSIPQPSRSINPGATLALSPPTSTGSRPSADEARKNHQTKQSGIISMPPQIYSGHSGQHIGSSSVHSDKENQGNDNAKDKRDKGPAITGSETKPTSCRPKPRKGNPALARPRTKHNSRIHKSTPSRPDRRAARTTTWQGSNSERVAHQTRSSQRLTRRRQAGGSFQELDSRGKARSVVA